MMEKYYKITTWADGFGKWHGKATFSGPLGNSGEAERIKYAGVEAAKRAIRLEIVLRESMPVGRIKYEVKESDIDSLNRMWSITIMESYPED